MQSNWLSSIVRRISALNVAILFLVATALPIIGVIVAPKAGALPTDLVINEVHPGWAGNNVEWVELYNPTPDTVDLTDWTISRGPGEGANDKQLSGNIAPFGFIVLETSSWLNNNGTTLGLKDASSQVIDQVAYSGPLESKSYARVTDAAIVWEDRTGVGITKNSSNNLTIEEEEQEVEEELDEEEQEEDEPVEPEIPAVTSSTEVITGNTAIAENQPGWLFNRDTGTATPYEFNSSESSIGSGSLNVLPIGTNPSDKFIAENFILSPIDQVNQISYDFKIGAGGNVSDANEFYMNVYANFGESSPTKFYDCRYSVVPAISSVTDFNTVTFDPSQDYAVVTSGSSPYTCPSSPAAMDGLSSGSTIRMFTLNVGDTSASDVGLDGYLDNVVVDKTTEVTTYDFEPDTTAPAKPQMLGIYKGHNSNEASFLGCDGVTSLTQIRIDWADNTEADLDYYWLGVAGNPKHKKVYANSFYDGNMTPGKASYYYTVIAVDKSGNESQISESCALKLDQMPPQVEITTPSNSSVLSGKVTISGKVVDDNPSHYYLVVKDESGEVVDGPGEVYAPDVVDYEWDTTVLANGTYSILLSARDKAGNKDVINFSVDTITVTVQNPGQGGGGEEEEGEDGGRGGVSNSGGTGQITVTVVSSATNQSVQAETAQDQVLGTATDDDSQNAEGDTEVLAENDDQDGDGDAQEEPVEDTSNTWWWILGFLLLLLLLYLIFRRRKSENDQE